MKNIPEVSVVIKKDFYKERFLNTNPKNILFLQKGSVGLQGVRNNLGLQHIKRLGNMLFYLSWGQKAFHL
jgi:hypothetical protein